MSKPQPEVISVGKVKDFPVAEWAGETRENYFIITYSKQNGLYLGMSENGTTGARINLVRVSGPVETEPSFTAIANYLQWKLPENFDELN